MDRNRNLRPTLEKAWPCMMHVMPATFANGFGQPRIDIYHALRLTGFFL
jgi:hypothetical protein